MALRDERAQTRGPEPAPRTGRGRVTAFAGSLAVGEASDPTPQIGPMAAARQHERVESYIAKGRAEGARLTTGGGRPENLGRGWFVQPTVFADVDNSFVIAREEIFGALLSLILDTAPSTAHTGRWSPKKSVQPLASLPARPRISFSATGGFPRSHQSLGAGRGGP
ncbi:aldehyde dehydrogenase family protein [Streptomyces sp. NPDC057579]|uniref:aldehyde dehydrogenase family protein n=1 Tax=Streptomyces sp. NPDC057579 TaxID=3346172 RepID=UPI0036CBCF48